VVPVPPPLGACGGPHSAAAAGRASGAAAADPPRRVVAAARDGAAARRAGRGPGAAASGFQRRSQQFPEAVLDLQFIGGRLLLEEGFLRDCHTSWTPYCVTTGSSATKNQSCTTSSLSARS
jgi:hypothetical protein